MATKALNCKLDDAMIADIDHVAGVYHMTKTELIKEAIAEFLGKLKNDPFYKLTSNVADAGEEEAAEILDAIERMNDDDLMISSSRRFTA